MQEAIPRGVGALSERPRRLSLRTVIYACTGLSVLLAIVTMAGTWGVPVLRTVHLTADGKNITIRTFKQTVSAVLASRKISLRDGDRVTPAMDTPVSPDLRIKVVRAVPFLLVDGGRAHHERVAAETVRGALHRLDVWVRPPDKVYPAPATVLRPGARVTIERREWHSWIQRAAVPYVSEVVNDAALFKGNTVVRAGRPGMKERVVKVLYANGKPAVMEPQIWRITQAPVPRVTEVGTRAMIASRGAFAGREYMVLQATAYYPGPDNFGGGVDNLTATGMLAQRGVVAVDPSVIPLGTRLYVEGYGYAVAADVGSAIRGRRIDLCYNTYGEAMRFGRREVRVYILGR